MQALSTPPATTDDCPDRKDTLFSSLDLDTASLLDMATAVIHPLHDEGCSFCGYPIDRQGYNNDGMGPHDCRANPIPLSITEAHDSMQS
jgi:hypothetical protein